MVIDLTRCSIDLSTASLQNNCKQVTSVPYCVHGLATMSSSSSAIELPPSYGAGRRNDDAAEYGLGDDDDDADEEMMPMISSGDGERPQVRLERQLKANPTHQPKSLRHACLDCFAAGRYVIFSSSKTCRAVWIICTVMVMALYINHNNSSSHEDDFPPFCDPVTGECGETPWVASPRTKYSAWTQEQLDLWWTTYDAQELNAYKYVSERYQQQAQKAQGDDGSPSVVPSKSASKTRRPLILLGDSITESWNGTGLGIEKQRCTGSPQVLQDKLVQGGNFDPLILAVSGDQTQHLLYRLETLLDYYYNSTEKGLGEDTTTNDEVAASDLRKAVLEEDPTAVYVMMIGTNNLGSGELPGPTSQGILATAEYVLKHSHPSSRLLLFELLPRGDGRTVLPNVCPPRCTDSGEPFQSFMPAINKVNDLVQAGIKPLQTKYPYEKEEGSTSSSFFSRIEFVDCGSQFLTKGTTREEVDLDLMPDRLHPNAKGMEIIADCILEFAKA